MRQLGLTARKPRTGRWMATTRSVNVMRGSVNAMTGTRIETGREKGAIVPRKTKMPLVQDRETTRIERRANADVAMTKVTAGGMEMTMSVASSALRRTTEVTEVVTKTGVTAEIGETETRVTWVVANGTKVTRVIGVAKKTGMSRRLENRRVVGEGMRERTAVQTRVSSAKEVKEAIARGAREAAAALLAAAQAVIIALEVKGGDQSEESCRSAVILSMSFACSNKQDKTYPGQSLEYG